MPNSNALRRTNVNTCQHGGSNFSPGGDSSDYSVHKYDSVRLFICAYLGRKSLLVFSSGYLSVLLSLNTVAYLHISDSIARLNCVIVLANAQLLKDHLHYV